MAETGKAAAKKERKKDGRSACFSALEALLPPKHGDFVVNMHKKWVLSGKFLQEYPILINMQKRGCIFMQTGL